MRPTFGPLSLLDHVRILINVNTTFFYNIKAINWSKQKTIMDLIFFCIHMCPLHKKLNVLFFCDKLHVFDLTKNYIQNLVSQSFINVR